LSGVAERGPMAQAAMADSASGPAQCTRRGSLGKLHDERGGAA